MECWTTCTVFVYKVSWIQEVQLLLNSGCTLPEAIFDFPYTLLQTVEEPLLLFEGLHDIITIMYVPRKKPLDSTHHTWMCILVTEVSFVEVTNQRNWFTRRRPKPLVGEFREENPRWCNPADKLQQYLGYSATDSLWLPFTRYLLSLGVLWAHLVFSTSSAFFFIVLLTLSNFLFTLLIGGASHFSSSSLKGRN